MKHWTDTNEYFKHISEISLLAADQALGRGPEEAFIKASEKLRATILKQEKIAVVKAVNNFRGV